MHGGARHLPAGEVPLGRILWRCRRGMKELDVVLERFARAALPGASAAECAALERLLSLPDPLLAGYLLGEEYPADPELARLTCRMRELCIAGPVGAILAAASGRGAA